MDDYVIIATAAIEKYVRTSRKLTADEMKGRVSEETLVGLIGCQAGAFVSMHKEGALRGCIGTTGPTSDNLFEEIVHSAISACSSDPRFYPVREEELSELEIKVDRLYPAEPISELTELDVVKYGVIVEKGFKRGLLLPNLDGVDTIKAQVTIALQKAGLTSMEGVTCYRFEVERHA